MGKSGRRPLVAGNWKMHKTAAEALALVADLKELGLGIAQPAEVAVAPPFTALYPVARALEDSSIALAAQTCHWEPAGAFTGEIAAPMLEELGCRYVIVGHSERRQYFGETDATVNRRARAVLASQMRPIVCVGETLAQREGGQMLDVIARQLAGGLSGLSPTEALALVIAYEPVWAIGTGKNATSAQAQEVHAHIREQLTRAFGREVAEQVRIQYGGSVKPENAADLLSQPDVDGALVGGASLRATDFAAIVRSAMAGERAG